MSNVKGIGKAKALKLEEKGITTIEQLSIMDPDELRVILGISSKAAQEIIADAKTKATAGFRLLTAQDLLEERKRVIKRISTGSSELDKILGGGIETMALTGIYGRFGSGKSQLCYQVVYNCVKHLKKKAVWIETEPQTFRGERLLEIAKLRGETFSLSDVIVIPGDVIKTTASLYNALQFVNQKLKAGENIGVLVIDSFNAPLRSEFGGRETLPTRSQAAGRIVGFLQYLAKEHNLAILLTVQVMGVPDEKLQGLAIRSYGIPEAPVVPEVVKHAVNYWIGVGRLSSKDLTHFAVLADGPLPREQAIFIIDRSGVRDLKSRKGV